MSHTVTYVQSDMQNGMLKLARRCLRADSAKCYGTKFIEMRVLAANDCFSCSGTCAKYRILKRVHDRATHLTNFTTSGTE